MKYYLTATSGNAVVKLLEQALVEDERIVRLTVNHRHQINLVLPRFYLPGVAFRLGEVAIWCGMKIFFIDCSTGSHSSHELSDEILTAYGSEELWWLICETSVAVFEPGLGVTVAKVDHDEVLTDSWWNGETLIVEDFEKRRYRIEGRFPDLEMLPAEGCN